MGANQSQEDNYYSEYTVKCYCVYCDKSWESKRVHAGYKRKNGRTEDGVKCRRENDPDACGCPRAPPLPPIRMPCDLGQICITFELYGDVTKLPEYHDKVQLITEYASSLPTGVSRLICNPPPEDEITSKRVLGFLKREFGPYVKSGSFE